MPARKQAPPPPPPTPAQLAALKELEKEADAYEKSARDYRGAIGTFRAFVGNAPAHPRAPEALLAVANCQVELKDVKGAKATLAQVLKSYPQSEAAGAAKDHLASLK